MSRRQSLLLACVFGNLLAVSGGPGSALAAEVGQVRETKTLADALAEFASRSGLQVIYVSEIVAGRTASGRVIESGVSPQDELRLMLEATGLRFEFLSPNTVGIFPDDVVRADGAIASVSGGDLKMNYSKHAKKRVQELARGSVLALSLAGAAPQAQEGTAPGLPEARQAPAGDSGELAEVVVTARARAERLIDVPVAATTVGEIEIRKYNITALNHLSKVVPTISFDRGFTGAGSSISMRGVSSSNLDAGLEQSVLIMYDGMPISRGRILSDAIFDIEAVEVLKGPQSLFFGKDSPGGVVSVRSVGPTAEFEGVARVSYETTSRNPSLEGAISGPISDSLGFRLAVFASESDGYLRNQATGIVDPFRTARLPTFTGGTFVPAAPRRLGAEDRYGARGTLRFSAGDFDATLKLLMSRSKSQGLQSLTQVMSCPAGVTRPRLNGIADPTGDCRLDKNVSTGFVPPAVIDAWPEARGFNSDGPSGRNISYLPSLTMNYKAGDLILTSVTSLYDYAYRSSGNADATAYSFFWTYQKEKNTSFVQEFRLVSDFDGPLNFAAGGYYEHVKRANRNGTLNGPSPVDPDTGKLNAVENFSDSTTEAYSMFGQITYDIFDTLELAGGARYSHVKKTVDLGNLYVNAALASSFLAPGQAVKGDMSEDKVSPEATLTWRVARDVMIYGAYKTGYLAGGFSKPGTLSPTLTVDRVVYGPEKAHGFEAGTKFSVVDGRLEGSLTGYRYIYKGLQLTSFNVLVFPPVFQTTNVASTSVKGAELQLTYRPVAGLTLHGNVEYNRARYRSFPGAQCYAGQTAALGCTRAPGSTSNVQDLSGKVVWRAPKWVSVLGASYDFQLGAGLKLGLNADVKTSSGYFVSVTENPGSFQKSYQLLNAGIRLGSLDDRWAVSVIGTNLTNEYYATVGTDKPGGAGEVMAVAADPRFVTFQLEMRF